MIFGTFLLLLLTPFSVVLLLLLSTVSAVHVDVALVVVVATIVHSALVLLAALAVLVPANTLNSSLFYLFSLSSLPLEHHLMQRKRGACGLAPKAELTLELLLRSITGRQTLSRRIECLVGVNGYLVQAGA